MLNPRHIALQGLGAAAALVIAVQGLTPSSITPPPDPFPFGRGGGTTLPLRRVRLHPAALSATFTLSAHLSAHQQHAARFTAQLALHAHAQPQLIAPGEEEALLAAAYLLD